jgi:type III restriction enzyme
VAKISAQDLAELVPCRPEDVSRLQDLATSTDRTGAFSRTVGYEGWKRSLYEQVWFDSATERQLALIFDDATDVQLWVRLHRDDLPILWQSDGREYNPDFIAVENGGTHWLVEAKMNKEMEAADVKGKETAAQRWANYVSADKKVDAEWRYLLVSEDDVESAKGDWKALKRLGVI